MERKVEQICFPSIKSTKLKRVAAYARVSSGKDAMLHSLSAQVSHYSNYIQCHKGWAYVGVYSDEAVTGTKGNREGFQQLLTDCKDGKIDMVITKSISRFARNTVMLLDTVRELKSIGVDVYFEEQNIHSMSSDGELMLTILASYAQEESLSVSENQKWRMRKNFSEGRPSSTTMLGYKLVDGTLYIIEEEAEIVRMIFNDFLSGMGRNLIVKKLRGMGIESKRGGTWSESGIGKMLRNEKYTGDMLLQKTYIEDHISKRKRNNKGELPMYYVENSHEPIIDKDTFAKVQAEMDRRHKLQNRRKPRVAESYPFTSIMTCGICGKHYRRKIANAGGKYEKPIWICATFNSKGKAHCHSKQISESILQDVAAEVLGLSSFDETAFTARIKQVLVPQHNTLVFVFKDGTQVQRTWSNKSRKDSWSEEMREQARQQILDRRKP